MANVVVVTSGKGGVGKTTSTAALGAALAQAGERAVVVDFDVGLRNLDLVMGAERRVVFDLINVTQGGAKLSQALIRDKRIERLWLLPASQTRDKDALTEEGVANLISELRSRFEHYQRASPVARECLVNHPHLFLAALEKSTEQCMSEWLRDRITADQRVDPQRAQATPQSVPAVRGADGCHIPCSDEF